MNKVIAYVGDLTRHLTLQIMMFCLVLGAGAQSLVVVNTLRGPEPPPTVLSPSMDPVPVIITTDEDTRGDVPVPDDRVSTSYEDPLVKQDRNPPLRL